MNYKSKKIRSDTHQSKIPRNITSAQQFSENQTRKEQVERRSGTSQPNRQQQPPASIVAGKASGNADGKPVGTATQPTRQPTPEQSRGVVLNQSTRKPTAGEQMRHKCVTNASQMRHKRARLKMGGIPRSKFRIDPNR